MCARRSQHYGAVTTPENKSARAWAALIVIETPPATAVASGHSASDQALRTEDEGFLFLVPNALHRYKLNNVSHLTANADGSTSIWLASERPKNVAQSNWLPTADGRRFSLNFRAYVPKQEVEQGEWFPAPIMALK
jgi:hypothetical protein